MSWAHPRRRATSDTAAGTDSLTRSVAITAGDVAAGVARIMFNGPGPSCPVEDCEDGAVTPVIYDVGKPPRSTIVFLCSTHARVTRRILAAQEIGGGRGTVQITRTVEEGLVVRLTPPEPYTVEEIRQVRHRLIELSDRLVATVVAAENERITHGSCTLQGR